MRCSKLQTWLPGFALSSVASLMAQAPSVGDPAPDVVVRSSVRLDRFAVVQEVDGALRGAGEAYKVHFLPDGIEFVPRLGRDVPRNMPVRLALASIRRNEGEIIPVEALPTEPPVVKDLQVLYHRGFVVERYDVREDEVEQSFVFDQLPGGKGDLVVRLHMDTELAPFGDGRTLDLRYEDRGGVRIGAVTGIDANGVRAEGSLRYVDGALELGLPASFVDRAALPLVLDPTLGTQLLISNSWTVNNERGPDIAYDRSSDSYLCVWERIFSHTDADVMGQRLSPAGSKLGSPLLIESDNAVDSSSARVANQNANDMFVVVWCQSGDIWARAVRASDGVFGAPRGVVTSADTEREPDLASEASFDDDDVVMVYHNVTQTVIQARTIHANETTFGIELPAPGIVTVSTASSTYDDVQPAISSSGGADSTFLVVWRRVFGSYSDIRGQLFDRQLNRIGGFLVITNTTASNQDETAPACDGDGRHWVVAYEREESSTGAAPLDLDIHCRSIVRSPNGAILLSAEVALESTGGEYEGLPAVAWLGDSAVVTWTEQNGQYANESDLWSRNINPLNCSACEGFESIFETSFFDTHSVIATRFSGGAASAGGSPIHDDAFILCESWDPIYVNHQILGRRYSVSDGAAFDRGGGCGDGGEAFAACPHSPHNGFEFQLLRAAPNSASWLIASPESRRLSCGGCTLLADPFRGFVVSAGNTSSAGNASVAVGIPSSPALVGVSLWAQWLVADATPACTSPAIDMSNALFIRIE